MDLSPEEKQRVYEEEKARLEAQDKIKKEKVKQPTPGKAVLGCLAIIAVLVIIGVAIGVCSNSSSPTTIDQPTIYTVKYEATGSAASVSLTYTNKDGGTSQESNVSLPWTHSFAAVEGDFAYISAQNNGESGSVTVTIYLNDVQVKTSTSTGGYVIATANGRI